MKAKKEHLIFYDGQCGLCDRVVDFLLKVDREKTFVFAPLQGKTAEKLLQSPRQKSPRQKSPRQKGFPDYINEADSLILVENYKGSHPKITIFGHAAFRIAWLLGKWWLLIGWISFLPPPLYNWGYRLIARNRQRFFSKKICQLPDLTEKDRFLP